jgi:HAD superfamily hydrolase (TIGR01509 family)
LTPSVSKAYELVIFDCDGVLVDSEPIANRLFAEMLCGEGLALTTSETRRRYMGRSFASCRELIEAELGRPLPGGFFAELRARTLRAFRHELRRVEGVGEVLDQISTPVCVASSSAHERLLLSLEVTDLLSRFEGRIFSAYDVARGKPAPDLFLHAAQRMGAAPERCAVIEDSAPGVEAGVSAGMNVYGYAWHGDVRALHAAGARVFHRMSELPALLVPQLARPAEGGEEGST